MLKIFGQNPKGERLQKIKKMPSYNQGAFTNISKTEMIIKEGSMLKVLKENMAKPANANPLNSLPNIKTNLFEIDSKELTVIWFGHSSYLLMYKNTNILVDPVFSGFASPVKIFGKAYKGSNIYDVQDMPPIDVLVLTHDHYDHLDYNTIKKLHPSVKNIITSLGVGQHLEYWGISNNKITELNWGESITINGNINLTATPARHFSGRGIRRAKTLWSSFVLQFFDKLVFIGGDSGYDTHFATIGKQFKKFDIAFLECGQYGKYWPYIHMLPEQTLQAAADLNTTLLFPVHWAKFTLSSHPWNEPINRLLSAAKNNSIQLITPKIGEPYRLNEVFKLTEWWQ
jgi:L-ascorbate metabolism protein UlaG (beta-lactamase superfamily)